MKTNIKQHVTPSRRPRLLIALFWLFVLIGLHAMGLGIITLSTLTAMTVHLIKVS